MASQALSNGAFTESTPAIANYAYIYRYGYPISEATVTGMLTGTHRQNINSGVDHEYASYTFNNLLEKRLLKHQPVRYLLLTEEYTYQYDHAGRMVKKLYSLNNAPSILMVSYGYNRIGQLATKNTGGIETTGMSYNVRGWLTGMEGERWSEQIYYQDARTYYFNGNISRIEWKTGDATQFDEYTFTSPISITCKITWAVIYFTKKLEKGLIYTIT